MQDTQMTTNQSVTDRLLQARGYFSAQQSLFDSIAKQSQKLESIERFRNVGTGFGLLILIGFVVYCWKCFLPMGDYYAEQSPLFTSLLEWLRSVLSVGWALLAFLAIGLVLFLGIYFVGAVLATGVWMGVKSAMTAPAKTKAQTQLTQALEALAAHYQQYKAELGDDCPVPFDRCHPGLIGQLLDTIACGRADTVKEAINVIVQDEHNQRMEQMGAQQVQQLQQANAYLRQIQSNTSWTAWNTFWR